MGGSSEAARPWEVVGTREISDAERAAILRISPHVIPRPSLRDDLTWPAGLAVEQEMPTKNDAPSVQGMVRDDLVVRERLGRERYGTHLQPHNGRDALRDAYEEALDLACYLRQAIAERVLGAQAVGGLLFGSDAHGGQPDGIGSHSVDGCDWPAMQCRGHAMRCGVHGFAWVHDCDACYLAQVKNREHQRHYGVPDLSGDAAARERARREAAGPVPWEPDTDSGHPADGRGSRHG